MGRLKDGVTTKRTKEIGIRMALGSSRWLISRLVFSDVLKLASAGMVAAVAILAALLPARKAASVEPSEVLRAE
ncbi:FtsX-like permease family protein [Edaphobacter albus]|uniref:FtsX-like permease family protein n=1 Tax=Edaphobacter sp. 4G125 TaxID=2763071 RepID=UPI001644EE9E|nr:FtsX-like permease family protein [Edaphobacter sp. 4G125]QNI37063.1 hypothetical protein H7846_01620 [Edaphobacter sp. 4G125]